MNDAQNTAIYKLRYQPYFNHYFHICLYFGKTLNQDKILRSAGFHQGLHYW